MADQDALQALIDCVGADTAGGLLSRETIRMADEGRLLLSRLAEQGASS